MGMRKMLSSLSSQARWSTLLLTSAPAPSEAASLSHLPSSLEKSLKPARLFLSSLESSLRPPAVSLSQADDSPLSSSFSLRGSFGGFSRGFTSSVSPLVGSAMGLSCFSGTGVGGIQPLVFTSGSAWRAPLSSLAFSSSGNSCAGRSPADLRCGSGWQGRIADHLAPSAVMQQRRGLSKLKKYKMKSYSSYKERFTLMADGTYKRWRSGTRHNAHSKTAKQRRQLRRPSVAPAALAKVMKKLNFVR